MTRKQLESMANRELQQLEDMIDQIQRERVSEAIKAGVIKFKNSKTLMEWWRS